MANARSTKHKISGERQGETVVTTREPRKTEGSLGNSVAERRGQNPEEKRMSEMRRTRSLGGCLHKEGETKQEDRL